MMKIGFAVLMAIAAIVSYPTTPRGDASQAYFGTVVRDPYRWLENTQSVPTKQWVAAETTITTRVLDDIPSRDYFYKAITRLGSARGDTVPSVGTHAAVIMTGSGELIVEQHGAKRLLLDPKVWGSQKRLADWDLSPDGLTLAYGTETAGNGWVRWHTLNITTGNDIPGEVIGTPDWAPITWAPDSSGFYYDGYMSEQHPPAGVPIGSGFIARFHHVGMVQSDDRTIYARPDRPTLLPVARETDDGHYLMLTTVGEGAPDAHAVIVKDLHDGGRTVATISPPNDQEYHFIDNQGEVFYFFSHAQAPRGKVIKVDLKEPTRDIVVIPESKEILGSVVSVGDRFVAHYFRDAATDLVVFDRRGIMIHRIALPGVGATTDMWAAGPSTGYYTFSSPSSPPNTYAYNLRTNVSRVYTRARKPGFNAADYVTEELFASSSGGARVPVFVAHRRGLKLDGTTPTMLTGYGALGIFNQPLWENYNAAWLERGGAFAIACVRGGGEYGEEWHQDGMLANKQHSFDDFAAAARLLISKGFASPKTLTAYGYSGGGLLVGVTEVQHPELFSAVAEEAGPVDALRSYAYVGESFWSNEVGSPLVSPEQFKSIYDYAPLVHIEKGTGYPATFVMTSQNDANVSQAHAYKFVATLQWAQANPQPIVLYVAPDSGHEDAMTSPIVLGDTEAFLWANSTSATRSS